MMLFELASSLRCEVVAPLRLRIHGSKCQVAGVLPGCRSKPLFEATGLSVSVLLLFQVFVRTHVRKYWSL